MPRTRATRTRRRPVTRAIRRDTTPNFLDQLSWRCLGPYRGGRVVAVAGDAKDRLVHYFGSTGGGVWKTTDGGAYWKNVSDGYFQRASVGAIAVSESDPNVVYVGMGEATIRGNVSHGDGVYRSTDAGNTWRHLGLERTRNIGKVRVHPTDPDVVYVAALGHAHGANRERGVFRSRDGGKTWQHVLSRGDRAGAIDIAIDANNPRILYASFWEAIRRPWELVSGGPGSGIFKSTDGGDTWTELTRKEGLPRGVLGKIGIAVSRARRDRVWAIVEAEDGAVFRSDDGGETWQRLSEERNLRQRAWYYHHIYADPKDADTVWVLNVEGWRSIDGGKTFERFAIPHGDNHDLWIDPNDPRRMIEGNDGGATVTLNGGETWSTLYNQPTCEFYHLTTDTQFPYRVYGSQQDNTTNSVPSRAAHTAISHLEAEEIGGGESGYIAVRPDDPNIVFAGNYQGYLTRYDRRTAQSRNVMVWPEFSSGWGAKDVRYRFQWTFPIVLSPHDPNVLYVTGNHVFRSTDEGATWETLSPDLTRNDRSKLGPSGGPITKDNTGAEYYATIFAFAESPRERGVLWSGSDDGLVHVSRDGGKTWRNVTPRALPEWATIRMIEPSPHGPATAYIAAERYRLDDFRPYMFKTTDYGRTWTKIVTGIADDHFARAIREDPERPGLLFAGTEVGLYVSFNGGTRWERAKGKLPVVPIHDLVVKDSDLLLATHGRSFWVLDDRTPLLRWQAERVAARAAHLFTPGTAYRVRSRGGFGGRPIPGRNYRFTGAYMFAYEFREDPETNERINTYLDAASNPPDGVIVNYWLRKPPEGEVELAFLDARSRVVREFSSKKREEPAAPPPEAAATAEDEEEEKEPRLPKKAGLNRFVWNMRYPDATKVAKDVSMEDFERALAGPVAPPGAYRVRLRIAGDDVAKAPFEIRMDPRVRVAQADLQAQFDLLLRIRDKLTETHDAVNRIRELSRQIDDWERRTKERSDFRALSRTASTVKRHLAAIEDELIQTKARSRQDTLNFPIKLNAKLGGVVTAVASADAPPTRAQQEVFADLSRRIDAQLARLRKLLDTELKDLNARMRRAGVPAIVGSTERSKR